MTGGCYKGAERPPCPAINVGACPGPPGVGLPAAPLAPCPLQAPVPFGRSAPPHSPRPSLLRGGSDRETPGS